jgi:hypothetical protein
MTEAPPELDGKKVIFKECSRGHGRLLCETWIDYGCHICQRDMLCDALRVARIYLNGSPLKAAQVIDEAILDLERPRL